jgi:four helix bundle protein
MKTHQDLEVWKDSIELTKDIYLLTENFPKFEQFALSSQMQRAVVSIASNIAEGAARGSDKDFIKFLYYSTGSTSELETQIIISEKLDYTDNIENILSSVVTIRKKLCGLIRFLKNKQQ